MNFNDEEAMKAYRFCVETLPSVSFEHKGNGLWEIDSKPASSTTLIIFAIRLGWKGYSTKGWSWEEHFVEISECRDFIELDGELYIKAFTPSLTPIPGGE